MKSFASWLIKYRTVIVILIGIVTIFWASQIARLKISTDFRDLLPQTHPYINVHNEFSNLFGGANFLVMLIEVKKGDIFNKETLEKIKYTTDELCKIPGVDRYKIISIAQNKMRDFRITSWGFTYKPLMYPDIPDTEKEMDALKNAIWSNPSYYGTFVSYDGKKSLILADFFEQGLDYSMIYQELNRIRAEVEDGNHILSIVGYPMHIGTVRHMISKVNFILAGTALMIPVLLFWAYRSFWATLIVPSAGLISGIWGLGFMALMDYNLDPLIFVMPFLIALMAFRHSHQLYNRFYEEYLRHGDKMRGAQTVIENMFLAGLTSVVTDAFGIAIIAITPIPILRNIAVSCAFWSIITVFIGLLLTPLLLTYAPVSSKFMQHIERERQKDKHRSGIANRFADWLGPWLIMRRGRYTVVIGVLLILAFSYYWSERLIVGDAEVGSNLLYPTSRYNQDSERINRTHPLINPLYVIVAGKEREAIKSVDVIVDIHKFTRFMIQNSGAVGAQNLTNSLLEMSQKTHGDDPRWYGLPQNDQETLEFYTYLVQGGEPGDMDRFIDYHDQYTNIAFYFRDKTGPTIKRAIATVKEFIEKHSELGRNEKVQYKLAGGVIGVEAAINEVVAEKQLQTLFIALLGVFVFCTINFRSFKVGLALMLPLALSNFMAFAYMAFNQIGLSISTLPVSAAGIGMGVDYGIYLVARMQEERKKGQASTLNDALILTIKTYGKSIIYVAGTLVIGLLIWILSPLKFQAQLGMMLAVILFLNCLGAVFIVPVLILFLKPGFLMDRKNN